MQRSRDTVLIGTQGMEDLEAAHLYASRQRGVEDGVSPLERQQRHCDQQPAAGQPPLHQSPHLRNHIFRVHAPVHVLCCPQQSRSASMSLEMLCSRSCIHHNTYDIYFNNCLGASSSPGAPDADMHFVSSHRYIGPRTNLLHSKVWRMTMQLTKQYLPVFS